MSDTQDKPQQVEKQSKKIFLIAGVCLAITASFLWYIKSLNFVKTNDAYIDGYQVSISADLDARIAQLFVEEGDFVKQGQVLCKLDDSILLSKKIDAEATVNLLKQKVDLQKISLKKMQDIYLVAKQEFKNQIISNLNFDKIEQDYLYAQKALKVAEADLENGIAKLGIIIQQLQHTSVYAPRNGFISKRWAVEGDVTRFGAPIYSLSDIQNIWITANIEENKIENLKPGNFVQIYIDAYPDELFTGELKSLRASAASQFALIPPDNATGNFTKVVQRIPIKIQLDKPKSKENLYLFPGMSAEVKIKIK
jgi:membrane fusion protein (multidrug efflux system)